MMVQIHPSSTVRGIHLSFALLLVLAPSVCSFSWRSEAHSRPPLSPFESPSEILGSGSRLPDIYTVALSELKELESQPLCHRVAARLLVNNCQLLDRKDEAIVMKDSGRQLRDFIDSYAASLAICDLERGAFNIPYQCDKFREGALSQLTMRNEAYMHASTKEIDLCLSALAVSDSAWNTWVSYRHKALRFCEAARADNEKAQSVLLYQRLTKIIAKLTDGVEAELQRRMDDLDNRTKQAVERMEQFNPHIDKLQAGLARVESYLRNDMEEALKLSNTMIRDGLDHAMDLEKVLAILLKTVVESNSQVVAAQGESLELATRKVNDELSTFMTMIMSAASSSIALRNEIEVSRLQTTQLAERQNSLEEGLDRLVVASETLSAKHEDHAYLLRQASNITTELLDTLEETASAARHLGQSVLERSAVSTWWPYMVCPAISLVLGSYGLPPSITRNLVLLAAGEVVGVTISSYGDIRGAFEDYMASNALENMEDMAGDRI